MRTSTCSLVIDNRLIVRNAAMLLFYILQNNYLNRLPKLVQDAQIKCHYCCH
jgi:hypothetical protein